MLTIALAQINPIVGDLQGNAAKIMQYINLAKNQKAEVVIFPELALCGYPPEDLLYKTHFISDNLKALQHIVRSVKDIVAVVGFPDRDKKGRIYNAAAVINNGKIIAIYHKQALPNYGVFDEKRYFAAGEKNGLLRIEGHLTGITICEDIWVEGGAYVRQAKKKARLIINLSSSPFDVYKFNERIQLIKKRAQQTKAFVCYANLVGGQDELVFDGGSFVVDPKGKVIASARQFEEDLLVVDLDLGKTGPAAQVKSPSRVFKPLPQIEQVYQALVLGARDYVLKNGFKKVVIGLSGGVDSALVAALAVKAIGKENVIGVTMPSIYTSQATNSDSKKLAQSLSIQLLEIPIKDIFQTYLSALSQEFDGLKPNEAEENIQARVRGNILMALSNKFGWLVLTTGNKSEIAVGYCTLYGDMSGGFAVIKDVPKTMVYDLAEFINRNGQNVIPKSIIARAPTAELRPNQKDQDSLPPYEQLDRLLEDYVLYHKSLKALAKYAGAVVAKDIAHKVDINEYKRRQAPPGIKITQRAFGKDWRLPITNKYKGF